MGMLGFLDRAIALIAVVACQKVTRDLDFLAGRLSIPQAFTSDYCHRPYWSTLREGPRRNCAGGKIKPRNYFAKFNNGSVQTA